MKQIVLIIATVFLFFGCTQKQRVVDIQKKQEIPTTKQEQVKEEIAFDKLSEDEIVINEVKSIEDKDLDDVFKLAVVYPSKVVGKYANNTVNTITAYLLFKNEKFKVETFDTIDESMLSIENSVKQLKDAGYEKVIALFTNEGYKKLASFSFDSDVKIYFPLINKQTVSIIKDNFLFGGISYKKQIDLLQSLSNGKNIMYYQKNYLGNKLKTIYENSVQNIITIKNVESRNNDYRRLVNDNRLDKAAVMLNTSIIKTSIILSQIRAFEKEPEVVLSTQLNFNPLLISLTQAEDRTSFVLANSIDATNEKLEDILDSLGADIVYDWVNYSSLVGVNRLFDENKSGLIKTKFEENRVLYEPKLYKSTAHGFQKIK
ncbi:hypothetical protein CP960_02080 [Malaciobacter halophilus]|uniref:Periplasmic protein n=1 Tax=Malaciobacter halophilus TaxID=197482 RepID=A0A2N1J5S4_9BACT|nr:hypothetical protein [Malaciobacter halophilus]AXH09276.1 hypothetical protein AHALO_0891 [Malaciobacter halophilus]PKI81911.1 hypothetical protein CP960_02080 [Malaciobacter halophilus]